MRNSPFLFYVFGSHPLRLEKAVKAGAALKSREPLSSAGLIELLMGCLETGCAS